MQPIACRGSERPGTPRPLSGVVADALEFCYELSVEGTPLQGSRLVVEEQPVVVFCPNCHENRVLEDICFFRCPTCGHPRPS